MRAGRKTTRTLRRRPSRSTGITTAADTTESYREAKDECLFTVLVSVDDRDTAQDLVDEAFARAWASWRTVSRHPAPAAWVVRTALNTSISRWRRRRREVPVPDLALVADRPAASGGACGSVDPRIMAALLRLPARQRQVVALRLFLDLDTAGTAQVLGIAPGTVQAHLGRAKAALRDDLIPTRRAPDPFGSLVPGGGMPIHGRRWPGVA